ncbi:conserved Plasmodium protein, unknown function, partial [Plasmodium malariae]
MCEEAKQDKNLSSNITAELNSNNDNENSSNCIENSSNCIENSSNCIENSSNCIENSSSSNNNRNSNIIVPNEKTVEWIQYNYKGSTKNSSAIDNLNVKKEQQMAVNICVNDKEGTIQHIGQKNTEVNCETHSGFIEYIRLIEPLLVYCYCYGKEEVFILSSKCIKIIKRKKYSDFKKFGKLIILSSIDILKNIPNYYSKEFDKLILACIDTLTSLIKSNNKNDFMSWLNSDVSHHADSINNLNSDQNNKQNGTPSGTQNSSQNDSTASNNMSKIVGTLDRINRNHINKVKRQKKLNYLLDGNILSMQYNNEKEAEHTSYEESINSLRYCLINQISLLLDSKNHVWELLILFKNCMMREDINNIIKKGSIILKMNSCIDQIFTIMIKESYNLKLSFLCGQIYIDFLMRFPISQKEKKKKFFQILNNLNDENDDSRIAVLNTIFLFLNRVNAKLLKEEFYYVTYASLLVNFSNETNCKCKKMYVFLLTLLFQQVNDLNYVFNSYKILKHNLIFSLKSTIVYTYLYLLPVFTSIFFKNMPLYYQIILSEISFENNQQINSKEYKKRRKNKIKQLCSEENSISNSNITYDELEQGEDSSLEKYSENHLNSIRNYFLNELLRYSNNDKNKNKCNEEEKRKKKKEKNNASAYAQEDKIMFMRNQLEDLFLSLVFYIIGITCANIKTYMKEDKNLIHIFTSSQNIIYFCNHYVIYKEIDADMVYLFYKSLEQIFSYIDIDLIENLLFEKCIYEKYAHEKYKVYFLKHDNIKCFKRDIGACHTKQHVNIIHNIDADYEKLILYYLYFWNLIFENGLFNNNSYVQITSVKILLNYINKKVAYPFFPLLLVKLFSSNTFIINLIIKKILSLLLNSYFLEHFYIYHKEISFLLSKICKLLIRFPWITNGLEEEKEQSELSYKKNYIKNIDLNNTLNPCSGFNGATPVQNGIDSTVVEQNTPKKQYENKDDHLNNSSDGEEFNRVYTILQNEEHIVATYNTYDYKNDHGNSEIGEDIEMTKEMLSYSKFFLIIVTLSRGISLHLKNKKKSFTRILTILNTFKNIINDFPPQLWNLDNGIINNVISPLYKIASIYKKKYFVEDENIFEETSVYKKELTELGLSRKEERIY